MSWAAEEFATVDLGDKRLNKRLVKVVQQWADKPSQSIPTASGGWGDKLLPISCVPIGHV